MEVGTLKSDELERVFVAVGRLPRQRGTGGSGQFLMRHLNIMAVAVL